MTLEQKLDNFLRTINQKAQFKYGNLTSLPAYARASKKVRDQKDHASILIELTAEILTEANEPGQTVTQTLHEWEQRVYRRRHRTTTETVPHHTQRILKIIHEEENRILAGTHQIRQKEQDTHK